MRSTIHPGQPAWCRLGSLPGPRLDITTTMLALILLLASPSMQQKDPVHNFCRRFGHQTAVVDRRLYIDGGLVNWNPISTWGNSSNTWLLYEDLSTVADSGMPPLSANLSKNASIPNVHGGALWADDVNKRLFLFGGEFYSETPWAFTLFGYDILNNQWDPFGPPPPGTIQRVSYGAGVSVPSRGEAYYYGGWLSNRSISGWGDTPVATTGLVKYLMDFNSWTNSTGPDEVRRAEGALNFIPAGDAGMLVYFGGVQDLWQNGTFVGQPMDKIFIYEVLSGKWYIQRATGNIPPMRRRFCAGVTWAEDRSSYNIYLYGGAAIFPGDGPGFDDLYILTMPTFTWIKMFPTDRNGTGDSPHHSLSCNVVSNAQMLIIGGTFPLSQDCDAPGQWGTHNNDMGKQNDNNSPWDLYSPNKTKYAVPDEIVSVVGGGEAGAATKVAPAGGFDHPDLKLLMTRTAKIPLRTPTRDVGGKGGGSGDHALSTGAIVGIAVGAGVLLLAVIAGCWICFVQKKNRMQMGQPQPPGLANTPNHMMMYPPQQNGPSNMHEVPWSPHSPSPGTPNHYNAYTPYGGYPPGSPRSPAELAAGGTNQFVPPLSGSPLDIGQVPGQHGSYSDGSQTMLAMGDQPKFDPHSNMWIPQVSTIQLSPTHRPSSRHQSSSGGSPMQDSINHIPQHSPGRQYSTVSRTPQELPSERRSHSDAGSATSPRHQTYYHP